ncbi:MAG: DUF1254 domain-containing protein [Geminicoccaceae bacterium]
MPTPNADVIYSMSYLDLKETGPLVVAAPANVIGMFTDFFQRTITDVSAIGPTGRVAGSICCCRRAMTACARRLLRLRVQHLQCLPLLPYGDGAGRDGPDPAPAVANAELTRIYPLWAQEKDVAPMAFPNASSQRVDMMYPVDNTYWTKLKEFVDYEPVGAIDPELRGVLGRSASSRGALCADREAQELLLKAVETAPRMILASRQLGRPMVAISITTIGSGSVPGPPAPNGCRRPIRHRRPRGVLPVCLLVAPAMVMRTIGAGSKYPFTVATPTGVPRRRPEYRLHVPANPPAASSGRSPPTIRRMEHSSRPSRCCRRSTATTRSRPTRTARSTSGSARRCRLMRPIELHPDECRRSFLVALRLYGPRPPYDQSWKPDDIVKVE